MGTGGCGFRIPELSLEAAGEACRGHGAPPSSLLQTPVTIMRQGKDSIQPEVRLLNAVRRTQLSAFEALQVCANHYEFLCNPCV